MEMVAILLIIIKITINNTNNIKIIKGKRHKKFKRKK